MKVARYGGQDNFMDHINQKSLKLQDNMNTMQSEVLEDSNEVKTIEQTI